MGAIAIDAVASATVRFAAQELANHLSRMTGREYLITDDLNAADIALCKADAATHLPIQPLLQAEHDAVAIVPHEGRLYLVGNGDRAVLFAVYEYLSQLGVQWFAPGEEFVPRRITWRLPRKPTFIEASMKYRGHLIDTANKSINASNIASYIDWLAKNRANYLLFSVYFWEQLFALALPEIQKRGMILELGHHGFDFHLPTEKHFAKHPEWFSLVNGKRKKGTRHDLLPCGAQLCVSNKEAVNAYLNAFMRYVRKNPYAQIYGVIPNDGADWCECEKCMKIEGSLHYHPLFPRQVKATNRYLHIVRIVAEEMRKKHPGKRVSFWAYSGTIEPPEAVDLPPNTILSSFASVNRCYQHQFFDPECADAPAHLNRLHAETLALWRERYPGDIIAYDYYTKYIWGSLPKIMPDIIAGEVRQFAEKGCTGLITFAERANWWTYEINLLVHLRAAWDANDDWRRWLTHYTKARYGAAAPHMRRYLLALMRAMAGFGRPQWEFPEPALKKALSGLRSCERILRQLKGRAGTSVSLPRARTNLAYTLLIMDVPRKGYQAKRHFTCNRIEQSIASLEEAMLAEHAAHRHLQRNRGSGSLLFSLFNDNIRDGRLKRCQALIDKLKKQPAELRAADFDAAINGGAW